MPGMSINKFIESKVVPQLSGNAKTFQMGKHSGPDAESKYGKEVAAHVAKLCSQGSASRSVVVLARSFAGSELETTLQQIESFRTTHKQASFGVIALLPQSHPGLRREIYASWASKLIDELDTLEEGLVEARAHLALAELKRFLGILEGRSAHTFDHVICDQKFEIEDGPQLLPGLLELSIQNCLATPEINDNAVDLFLQQLEAYTQCDKDLNLPVLELAQLLARDIPDISGGMTLKSLDDEVIHPD